MNKSKSQLIEVLRQTYLDENNLDLSNMSLHEIDVMEKGIDCFISNGADRPQSLEEAFIAIANLLTGFERKFFLENVSNLRTRGNEIYDCPRMQFLYGAFYWDESPQGYKYWLNVSERLSENFWNNRL